MALKLKEKVSPKELKAFVPEKLAGLLEKYVKDSMKESNYPENAAQEAKDQIVTAAVVKIILADKKFLEANPDAAALARKFLH